jgi:hypothetical protein
MGDPAVPLTTLELNAAADFVAARAAFVSVHTADPAGTGGSEATGGAYGRKPLAWNPAASGDAAAVEVTIDVPAGTYTHFGLWSAGTGGVFRGGNPLTNAGGTPESAIFTSPGQIKVTVILDGSTS